jgi:ubiquinone/menaquinone biosynthesis C-methylase UbiE
MEADAKAYDEVSGPQIEEGIRFIDGLNLSLGDKVLDMGCGTGHITKYIAEIVGPEGQAVGIDPDAERIKIAQEKFKEIGNLQFYVGSSVTGFPHDNEPYYDVHISTNSFHWVPDDEKRIYIQKAYQCLKPGGRLAIWCAAKSASDDEARKGSFYTHSREGYQDMFHKIGLFKNALVDQPMSPNRFESLEEFKRWFKASTHKDADDYPKVIEAFLSTNDDGHVIFDLPCISIRARKD